MAGGDNDASSASTVPQTMRSLQRRCGGAVASPLRDCRGLDLECANQKRPHDRDMAIKRPQQIDSYPYSVNKLAEHVGVNTRTVQAYLQTYTAVTGEEIPMGRWRNRPVLRPTEVQFTRIIQAVEEAHSQQVALATALRTLYVVGEAAPAVALPTPTPDIQLVLARLDQLEQTNQRLMESQERLVRAYQNVVNAINHLPWVVQETAREDYEKHLMIYRRLHPDQVVPLPMIPWGEVAPLVPPSAAASEE